MGSQSVARYNNTTAGRDVTASAPTEAAQSRGGWFARLRKRGLLVALFTGVAGLIGVLTWLGWGLSTGTSSRTYSPIDHRDDHGPAIVVSGSDTSH
jgi:hypothetical protein